MKVKVKNLFILLNPNANGDCACASPKAPSTPPFDLQTVEDWFSNMMVNLREKNKPGQEDKNNPPEAEG